MLPVQSFAGSGIIRGLGQHSIEDSLSEAKCLLVAGRSVCLNINTMTVAWMTPDELCSLGFSFISRGGGGNDAFAVFEGGGLGQQESPLLYLGREAEGRDHEKQGQDSSFNKSYVAIDCSSIIKTPEFQQGLSAYGCSLKDLRPAMFPLSSSSPRDLSLAGHAAALSQWHQANLFCARCGSPTILAKGGAKRQCLKNPATHNAYPRTDPVVIMLVESPNGERVLLGRSRKAPPGMLSCLAGFIDIGETVEEAVRREVYEEAGVVIDPSSIKITGSQSWPVGRGASHELMIGCIARAKGIELVVDKEEVEECRWVGVDELRAALLASTSPESPYLGGSGKAEVKVGDNLEAYVIDAATNSSLLYVPPPLAIAHHLLKAWVDLKKTATVPTTSSSL